MSRLASLPTLDDTPRAIPKRGTKLARAIATKAARLADQKELNAWALAVKERDRWRDRRTGVRVFRTRQLDPLRAEAHHLEPKSNKLLRYDVRNGVCLSYATHDAVERHELRIVGTRWFTVGGRSYIDATFLVTFEPT